MKHTPFLASLAIGASLLLTGCFSKPHAQLSSNLSQIATEEPQMMHFEPDGVLQGIDIFEADGGSQVEISIPGTYLVVFSPQVASINHSKPACFKAWLTVNGEAVRASGVKECFSVEHESAKDIPKHRMETNKEAPLTDVLTGQVVHNFNQGDRIAVMFRGYNVQTRFFPVDGNIPSIPSSIISITKVS